MFRTRRFGGETIGFAGSLTGVRQVWAVAVFLALSQCGCIVVGGYSSTGGWFLWPGGLGLVLILAVAFLLLRRR